jgi:tyrosyl-tRNA synthetase
MGKTASGAVWLDGERLAPYDFYQYWIKTEDADVARFFKIYTFLSLEEIDELAALQGAEIRRAKEVLAYEVTRLTHGQEEAERAREASRALFGGAGANAAIPTTAIPPAELEAGIAVADLFERVGLAKTRSEARRLIQQGGAYVGEAQVAAVDAMITAADVPAEGLLLRAGKKRYHRVMAG